MSYKKYLSIVCFVAALGGFLFGFDTAVISGALIFVTQQFHLSAFMEGWFVSSSLLGCIIGVALAGKLSDVYGRKKVMFVAAVLFFLSSGGCMLAGSITTLIAFRLIGGLGIGVASMICPLYISEFSPAAVRGKMVSLYQLAITVGILAAYFSNAGILHVSTSGAGFTGVLHYFIVQDPWRAMIGLGVLPSLLFFLLLFVVPESPRWLALKGKEAEAYNVLLKINTPSVARNELNAITNVIKNDKEPLKELFSPVFRTALIIGICLPFLSQVSGINAVIYYGPTILDKAGFSLGNAFGGQVIIGIINVLFTLVAIFTVDRWGRRPLLMTGISGAVISLFITGLLFLYSSPPQGLLLTFLLLFISCFAFSFGPVAWIIVGEIFPGKVRGQAMSLATLSLWVANFLVGQLTPVMLKSSHFGPSATFWSFAAMCVPGLWLTWKLIPETKGKSLEQIEQLWKHKSNSRD